MTWQRGETAGAGFSTLANRLPTASPVPANRKPSARDYGGGNSPQVPSRANHLARAGGWSQSDAPSFRLLVLVVVSQAVVAGFKVPGSFEV